MWIESIQTISNCTEWQNSAKLSSAIQNSRDRRNHRDRVPPRRQLWDRAWSVKKKVRLCFWVSRLSTMTSTSVDRSSPLEHSPGLSWEVERWSRVRASRRRRQLERTIQFGLTILHNNARIIAYNKVQQFNKNSRMLGTADPLWGRISWRDCMQKRWIMGLTQATANRSIDLGSSQSVVNVMAIITGIFVLFIKTSNTSTKKVIDQYFAHEKYMRNTLKTKSTWHVKAKFLTVLKYVAEVLNKYSVLQMPLSYAKNVFGKKYLVHKKYLKKTSRPESTWIILPTQKYSSNALITKLLGRHFQYESTWTILRVKKYVRSTLSTKSTWYVKDKYLSVLKYESEVPNNTAQLR